MRLTCPYHLTCDFSRILRVQNGKNYFYGMLWEQNNFVGLSLQAILTIVCANSRKVCHCLVIVSNYLSPVFMERVVPIEEIQNFVDSKY